MADTLCLSTPGRICLFGEHQDYLGLPVVAAAISLRLYVSGRRRHDKLLRIELPDIGRRREIALTGAMQQPAHRDYLLSVVNLLRAEGVSPDGWDVRIHGEIPINSGTSSSTAMTVCWAAFLLESAGDPRARDPRAVAELAHRAEVVTFGEPGGNMDHFATSLGGLISLDPETGDVERYEADLGQFVLGDSMEPKDTTGILQEVKSAALSGAKKMQVLLPDFSLRTTREVDVAPFLDELAPREAEVLLANLVDARLCAKARRLLVNGRPAVEELGALLNTHQEQLQARKRISTPKIDRMLTAARKAGAAGGKINGSGGGGCMFAYAPEHAPEVARAVVAEGGRAWVISVAEGTRIEPADAPGPKEAPVP